MAPASGARLSVVIVTYESAAALGRSLPPLRDELRPGDELIVCDNGSTDGTVALIAELFPEARVIEAGENLGFAAGCNRAAAAASGDLLLLLNPDNVVEPGFREAIELPLLEGRGWGAWQGSSPTAAARILNTMGGVMHFTGIRGRGERGGRVTGLPAAPVEVPYPSGACLAIRRALWEEPAASASPTSSTTRTPTSACASASAGTRWESSRARSATTSTSSGRAPRSGATSSATAGRR